MNAVYLSIKVSDDAAGDRFLPVAQPKALKFSSVLTRRTTLHQSQVRRPGSLGASAW